MTDTCTTGGILYFTGLSENWSVKCLEQIIPNKSNEKSRSATITSRDQPPAPRGREKTKRNACSVNKQIHEKRIWAATWQNQQNECAPSEDSDQPVHPPSLIRVFTVRMKKATVLSYPLSAQRGLWSDCADAQADLSLRWAHSHFVCFVMSRLIYQFSLCQARRSHKQGARQDPTSKAS